MSLLLYIAVMAVVTYIIRVVPFTLLRRKIRSPFWLSFLEFIPYAVLAAMTIPAIFYSTGSPLTAAVGTAVEIDVRGRRIPAEIVPLPFYKRG